MRGGKEVEDKMQGKFGNFETETAGRNCRLSGLKCGILM